MVELVPMKPEFKCQATPVLVLWQLGVIDLILGLLLLRRDNLNPLRRIVLQAAIALVIISQLLMVIGAIVFSLFPSNIAE